MLVIASFFWSSKYKILFVMFWSPVKMIQCMCLFLILDYIYLFEIFKLWPNSSSTLKVCLLLTWFDLFVKFFSFFKVIGNLNFLVTYRGSILSFVCYLVVYAGYRVSLFLNKQVDIPFLEIVVVCSSVWYPHSLYWLSGFVF